MREAEFLAGFLNEELQVARSYDQSKAYIIDVTAHGLKGDGQFNNELVLRKLIKECRRTKTFQKLLFPQGEYFFSNSPGRSSIELIGIDNLTFEGRGKVTLLFDGKSVSVNNLLIESSRNLAFKNLTIDNRPLPFTLETIVAVNSGNEIDIDIIDPYPEPDSSYREAIDIRG